MNMPRRNIGGIGRLCSKTLKFWEGSGGVCDRSSGCFLLSSWFFRVAIQLLTCLS